jgi:uncharacterized membrane protein YcjF (UPF0283 family)
LKPADIVETVDAITGCIMELIKHSFQQAQWLPASIIAVRLILIEALLLMFERDVIRTSYLQSFIDIQNSP